MSYLLEVASIKYYASGVVHKDVRSYGAAVFKANVREANVDTITDFKIVKRCAGEIPAGNRGLTGVFGDELDVLALTNTHTS